MMTTEAASASASASASTTADQKQTVASASATTTAATTTTLSSEEHKTKYEMPSADDCPIFLRKTFTMIDTCDPSIAGWSADGTSFLVRDTDRLAKTVVPQFFKHNKWSSFVRQLNFYGFKKVKGEAVTLEQEEQLEGTVRFRHEHFVRYRPDLLVEIQRRKMLAQQQAAANAQQRRQQQKMKEKKEAGGAGRTDAANDDPSTKVVGLADAATKSEVKALRDRIAAMSRNIDNLATMVQNIQVRDVDAPARTTMDEYDNIEAGSKRKKVGASSPALLETAEGSVDSRMIDAFPGVGADGCNSIDPSVVYTPGNIFPPSSSVVASGEASMPPPSNDGTSSDHAFVDDLFAFNEDGLLDGLVEDGTCASENVVAIPLQMTPPHQSIRFTSNHNAPDPKLMKELTDALALLPREMQDNMVKRMVSTIVGTGPGSLGSQLNSLPSAGSSAAAAATAAAPPAVGTPTPMVVVENNEVAAPSTNAMEPMHEQSRTVVVAPSPSGNVEKKPEIALQIDSAMFNSLLEHLAKTQESKGPAGKPAKILPPIVSVH